jgi:hypothetical protein
VGARLYYVAIILNEVDLLKKISTLVKIILSLIYLIYLIYVLSWIVLDSSITFQNSYSFQCKEALFLTSKNKDWNLELKTMNYVAMEETLSPSLYHQSQSHSE